MSKHTINGFLVWEKWDWEEKASIRFAHYEPGPRTDVSSADRILIQPHSFEAEVPDNFDPTAAIISSLEEQKRLLRLRLAAELAEIDTRISKLQALPMPEAA